MADTAHTLTLTVPERIAKALESSGVAALEADTIVVLQALNWNMHTQAERIVERLEGQPSYPEIAELAGRVKMLAEACDEIERTELPARFRRPVEAVR